MEAFSSSSPPVISPPTNEIPLKGLRAGRLRKEFPHWFISPYFPPLVGIVPPLTVSMFIFASRPTVNAALRSHPLLHTCSVCLLCSVPSFSHLAYPFFHTSTSHLAPRGRSDSRSSCFASQKGLRRTCCICLKLAEKNFKGIICSFLPSHLSG